MKKRSFECLRNALLAGTFFVLLALIRGVGWESNDDATISLLLSRLGNAYSPFQGKLLGILLHALYIRLPVVDWWAVCTMFGIWAGTVATIYVLHRRYPRELAWVLTVLTFPLLWTASMDLLNFTRTAIVLAGGGCLLILLSVFSERRSAASYMEFVTGCLLLLFGTSVRSMCGLLALGFLAVASAAELLSNHFSLRPRWWKAHGRQLALLCLTAVLFFGMQGLQQALLTPEEASYNTYNTLRANVADYSGRYPKWETAQADYEALGLDQNDVNCLLNWLSEDTDRYTPDTLEQFAALGSSDTSFSHVVSSYAQCVKTDLALTVMLLAMLLLLCLLGKKNWKKILLPLAAAFACGLYLCWVGRLPSRVYASILWITYAVSLFLCGAPVHPEAEVAGHGAVTFLRRFFDPRALLQSVSALILVVSLLFACLGWGYVWFRAASNKQLRYTLWSSSIQKENYREKTFDPIDADSEHLYICDLMSNLGSFSDSFAFWEPRPTVYCENRFDLGGWDARHPYNVARLAEHGITNPIRALFELDNVYSTYSPRVQTLLNNHYDARITTSFVKKLNRVSIVQYTAPIDDSQITDAQKIDLNLQKFLYCRTDKTDAWYLRGIAALDVPDTLYCNLTYHGVRYTYRLTYHENGGFFAAYFYGLGPDFVPEEASLCFFTK